MTPAYRRAARADAGEEDRGSSEYLRCPMPGLVVAIEVKAGQKFTPAIRSASSRR